MVLIYDEASIFIQERPQPTPRRLTLLWTMPTPEFMEQARKELLHPCPEDCCPKPCVCDDCPACFDDEEEDEEDA